MTGEELRARRRAMGWTQQQLSGELGRSARIVSLWERDQQPIPRYIELSLWALEQLTADQRQQQPAGEFTKT